MEVVELKSIAFEKKLIASIVDWPHKKYHWSQWKQYAIVNLNDTEKNKIKENKQHRTYGTISKVVRQT